MNKILLTHALTADELSRFGISKELIDEIKNIPCETFIRMPQFKKSLIQAFANHGFVKRISLDSNHQLFITGKKNKVGLCIQMGHKAGFYFDLFKISYLVRKGKIDRALVILPSKRVEKFCNTSSVATYELISKQMSLFKKELNFDLQILKLDFN